MNKKLTLSSLVLLTLATFAISGCSWVSKEMHAGGGGNPPAMVAAPAVAPDTVKQMQAKLHDANFYHGNVDGVWGPATKAALHDFQVKHDIVPTGELDDGVASYDRHEPRVNNRDVINHPFTQAST